jgi:hypothetical protein
MLKQVQHDEGIDTQYTVFERFIAIRAIGHSGQRPSEPTDWPDKA